MAGAHPLPLIRFRAAERWSRGSPTRGQARSAVRDVLLALPDRIRGRVSEVTVTENRRHWVSVRSTNRGRWRLSLHWALLEHADVLRDALVAFAHDGSFGPGLQVAIDRASEAFDAEPVQAELPLLRAAGRHVDLAALLDRALALAPGELRPDDVTIGWSRSSGRARRSLRLGRADVERRRITIHPVLDQPYVPEYVVEMVVYHEVCHLLAPPLSRSEASRTRQHRVHHRTFRTLERRFPRLDDAEAWIRCHLSDLLRSSRSPA